LIGAEVESNSPQNVTVRLIVLEYLPTYSIWDSPGHPALEGGRDGGSYFLFDSRLRNVRLVVVTAHPQTYQM